MRAAIDRGWPRSGCELHPDKTKIVYCKDGNRRGAARAHVVHVPGLHLRAAAAREQERTDVHRVPARGQPGRAQGDGPTRSAGGGSTGAPTLTSDDLAEWINPIVRGWMNYYGRFYRSRACIPSCSASTPTWCGGPARSIKRLRGFKRAKAWWNGLVDRDPGLFAHWAWTRDVPATRMGRAV